MTDSVPEQQTDTRRRELTQRLIPQSALFRGPELQGS